MKEDRDHYLEVTIKNVTKEQARLIQLEISEFIKKEIPKANIEYIRTTNK